jgi:hypothetical protein
MPVYPVIPPAILAPFCDPQFEVVISFDGLQDIGKRVFGQG